MRFSSGLVAPILIFLIKWVEGYMQAPFQQNVVVAPYQVS